MGEITVVTVVDSTGIVQWSHVIFDHGEGESLVDSPLPFPPHL